MKAMTPTKKWLTIGAVVAYVVSPIDLAPEMILGPFGFADDAVALFIGIRTWLREK